MLFVTNRRPRGSESARIGSRYQFDLASNAASNSVFYCKRTGRDAYVEIKSRTFLTELRLSTYRQILVYLHGFNNFPESDIFPRAEALQSLCDSSLPDEVLVVPVIWPCDAAQTVTQKVTNYWDDQKSADQSGFSFARVLGRFLEWRDAQLDPDAGPPCLKRINVLAHSMGNRVLREALNNWKKYDLPGGLPLLFRNIFLVAADIVNESLHKGEDGELICHSSRNVTVYYASDDIALRGSKVANIANSVASRRLGHSGPEDMASVPANVYAVDCDDVNWVYDPSFGHTYFLSGAAAGTPGVVFRHMFESLKTGRVEASGEGFRTHRLTQV